VIGLSAGAPVPRLLGGAGSADGKGAGCALGRMTGLSHPSRMRPEQAKSRWIIYVDHGRRTLVSDPQDPSLIEAAEAALAASSQRIVVIEHGGAQYVAKRLADRPRPLLQALFVRWAVKWITRQSLPMRTLLLSGPTTSVDYEARRLVTLAKAGARVPRLVHRGAGYLLLEHCGPTVAAQLEAWPVDTCRLELRRLAVELGDFHCAGHWHGAAQIKNLTTKNGQTWRIDFEENFGELVPLPVVQAVDIVLFLNSISLVGVIDNAEARVLLPRLLHDCLAANPDQRVRDTLARGLPWISSLAWLSTPFRGWTVKGRQRKGAARLGIMAETLAAHFKGQ
jgi:hypothetical protein